MNMLFSGRVQTGLISRAKMKFSLTFMFALVLAGTCLTRVWATDRYVVIFLGVDTSDRAETAAEAHSAAIKIDEPDRPTKHAVLGAKSFVLKNSDGLSVRPEDNRLTFVEGLSLKGALEEPDGEHEINREENPMWRTAEKLFPLSTDPFQSHTHFIAHDDGSEYLTTSGNILVTVHTTVVRTSLTREEFDRYSVSLESVRVGDNTIMTLKDDVRVWEYKGVLYPLFMDKFENKLKPVLVSGIFSLDSHTGGLDHNDGRLVVVGGWQYLNVMAVFRDHTVTFSHKYLGEESEFSRPRWVYFLQPDETGQEMVLASNKLEPVYKSSVGRPEQASTDKGKLITSLLNRLFVWPDNHQLEWGKTTNLTVFISPALDALETSSKPVLTFRDQQYLHFQSSSSDMVRLFNGCMIKGHFLKVQTGQVAPYSVAFKAPSSGGRRSTRANFQEPWGRFRLLEVAKGFNLAPNNRNLTRVSCETKLVGNEPLETMTLNTADEPQPMPLALRLTLRKPELRLDSALAVMEDVNNEPGQLENDDHLIANITVEEITEGAVTKENVTVEDITSRKNRPINAATRLLSESLAQLDLMQTPESPVPQNSPGMQRQVMFSSEAQGVTRLGCNIIGKRKWRRNRSCGAQVEDFDGYRAHLREKHAAVLKKPGKYNIFCPFCSQAIVPVTTQQGIFQQGSVEDQLVRHCMACDTPGRITPLPPLKAGAKRK